MLGPLELPLFPSCYDCLSWSADGELAIAAGEYIQILTPKNTVDQAEYDPGQSPINNWHSSRFRVNVFTNNEWPTIDPQNRDNFSLGAEQSISTVVALAWSPPGLSKFRRCVLAVLTSNLLVSLYEPVGFQGKWTRVAIVNHALGNHFRSFIEDDDTNLRKSNIRSFAWSPPLKLTATEHTSNPYAVLPAESRWGWHLLSVANDDNDVIFLRVQRSIAEIGVPYEVVVLSVTPLNDPEGNYSQLQPSSVFAKILKSKVRILSMSWGPWVHASTESQKNSASGHLAVIYGTTLKMIRLDIDMLSHSQGTRTHLKLEATSKENTPVCDQDLGEYHFSGPLAWLHTDDSPTIYLAAGILEGLLLIELPKEHQKRARSSGRARLQELPFYESPGTRPTDTLRHLEPITAMLITTDTASQTLVLYGATAGGYMGAVPFRPGKNEHSIHPVPWQDQLDDIRERYDFDRDLGGLAVARAWGLTSYNGMVAAGITVHPGDMIEYRTAAEERLTIIISTPDRSQSNGAGSQTADSPSDLQHKREAVLGYILHFEDNDGGRPPLSSKILYATACCAIVESTDAALVYQAHKVLVRLATTTGADLNDELSKCSISKNRIAPKSADVLDGPGSQIFERCDICGAGVDWYSSQEAQCATGHVFVRCGVTSLAIQDPGASTLCSSCGREYLNPDGIESSEPDLQKTCRTLFDAFDTCVYCNGKYQF
ncbi:hypothetical protein BO94DRAFT_589134 [Aspergillus sclerotioniger CBS 115572]|uniref:Transcription factor IIIC putative zinc-finger domain-containing protein n=1 Tax=Aspergillus sclerotioniger CBS 115572 TaxID=1450535 RepID=A0A317VPY4_9EURO|nr:hypothetical protein BO94DRAFT_589134 [Aspergillus sclerotioniger CBS 115572]PWY75331.1 hypothetical protein BO94DRAFT_589134 [Aspergillus sclerotioniger CBS 115572]